LLAREGRNSPATGGASFFYKRFGHVASRVNRRPHQDWQSAKVTAPRATFKPRGREGPLGRALEIFGDVSGSEILL
jgi:hypothetical protein